VSAVRKPQGRDAWITGCGLISSLGADHAAQWRALADPAAQRAAVDSTNFAPFHVHPMAVLDLDRWMPRKPDQRSMGPLMRYGCVAAGMALESAGILGDKALLRETHLIVAAGGGERDVQVDEQILGALDGAPEPEKVLAQRLSTDLRPTLFLAQLPNLFAGNISIVHGVDGSSRTFMGEEAAGVDAVRIAMERLGAGPEANQGDMFLVGSAYNAESKDSMLLYQPGGLLLEGPFRPLWRRPAAGMCRGSAGAFLVIEERGHAEARGARPLARLTAVLSDHSQRAAGDATRTARRQWEALKPQLGGSPVPVLSAANGGGAATAEERKMLEDLQREGVVSTVRGIAGALGHSMEAAFPTALVLAVLCLGEKRLMPPLSPDDPLESAAAGPVDRIAVSCWGHHRGEGLALVEAVA
jgi:3-oxoacyl-[acyl-carrier-protein] synthase II